MHHKRINTHNFDAIGIKVASPEKIKEWSFGEVTKAETINYRTQRSEKSGLFDEKIFGPDKDFECYCGKYRGVRYKGIICEKCGVELTRSIVRRERMGHVELASPVSHIWFLRSIPSRIGTILGITTPELEKVIYFAGYIITNVSDEEKKRVLRELDQEYKTKVKSLTDDKARESFKELLTETKNKIDAIKVGAVLDEISYHDHMLKFSTLFEAEIGAEAIYNICKALDLSKLEVDLKEKLEKAGAQESEKLAKRLGLVQGMIETNIRPEWMFLTHIPIIPPAIRPMVPLDGGRYATSDVNDLYRRVINRNNRLKKLKDIGAPDVILRNEKRILQEAVDALIDNSIRHGSNNVSSVNQSQRRPLKSLADNLKGKRGIFRQNLLGKRVDYSGRSVIVVGPELALDECGLPKHMALELFRPFIISELLKKELAFNIRGASKLIDDGVADVWEILEDVITGKYVLLNRAPTLHRLGIQAFKPILIEGDAIQVHPLVCSAFNADFDGDQMAVHVPLSKEAQIEAREIMASSKNMLKPGTGEVTVAPTILDIVLGCFWLTKIVPGAKGEGKIFADPKRALTSYSFADLDFRASIKVRAPKDDPKFAEFNGEVFDTTVGRIRFNEVLPDDHLFINETMDRKKMNKLVSAMVVNYGAENLPETIDKIKNLGFEYATRSGITWGIDDVRIPEAKKPIIAGAKKASAEVYSQYNEGLLSLEERKRKNIEIWHKTKNEVEALMPDALEEHGSVKDMIESGARGGYGNVTTMAGMKGLIANTAGETIEFPITSCSKEGLTPIEYFITTHGSRKGLTDTALNTAKAGYLTRKLFVVAQDIVVTEENCKTKKGIVIKAGAHLGVDIPLSREISGRVLAADAKDDKGKTIFKNGHVLSLADAIEVEDAGVLEVIVKTPLFCETKQGICQNCYGNDIGTGHMVGIGEAVGTVAAQAIGEPGTQLTMRTFHAGGTASVGGDITMGLPRVEELFEKRKPKNPAVICHIDGTITEIREEAGARTIVLAPDTTTRKKGDLEYIIPVHRSLTVKPGDAVVKGQMITDGSADLDELFTYAGREKAQDYIIYEISKLYELQGASVSRKHIEIIIRQMFSRMIVKDGGDSSIGRNVVVDTAIVAEKNAELEAAGMMPIKAEPAIRGIRDVSLSRQSFLSAASFEHTTRVLVGAAVRGAKDELVGLMENVIVGRLIPAGTGLPESPKAKMLAEKLKESNEEE